MFRVEEGYVILRDKASRFGVVVSGTKVVKPCFGIVVIATVTNGVDMTDVGGICNLVATAVQYFMIAPSVVNITRTENTAIIINMRDVAKGILAEEVGEIAALDANDSTRTVDIINGAVGADFANQLAVHVGVLNPVFGCAEPICVIREAVRAHGGKQRAAHVGAGKTAVIGGHAVFVVCNCISTEARLLLGAVAFCCCSVEACQLIGAVRVAVDVTHLCPVCELFGICKGIGILPLTQDIATVVIDKQRGGVKGLVILAYQAPESVIGVTNGFDAVFGDLFHVARCTVTVALLGGFSAVILVHQRCHCVGGVVAVLEVGRGLREQRYVCCVCQLGLLASAKLVIGVALGQIVVKDSGSETIVFIAVGVRLKCLIVGCIGSLGCLAVGVLFDGVGDVPRFVSAFGSAVGKGVCFRGAVGEGLGIFRAASVCIIGGNLKSSIAAFGRDGFALTVGFGGEGSAVGQDRGGSLYVCRISCRRIGVGGKLITV